MSGLRPAIFIGSPRPTNNASVMTTTTKRARARARRDSRLVSSLTTLNQALNKHANFGQMCVYSAACLTKIAAVDDTAAALVIAQGSVGAMLQVIARNITNQTLVGQANALITSCSRTPSTVTLLRQAVLSRGDEAAAVFGRAMLAQGRGGPPRRSITAAGTTSKTTIAAATAGGKDPDALLATAQSIHTLASGERHHGDLRQNMAKEGLIEHVAQATLKHFGAATTTTNKVNVGDADLPYLLACAKSLAPFAADKLYAKRVFDTNALPELMAACRAFADHAELARHVADLIAGLARHGDERIRKQLKAMGAVDLLVDLLARFPHDQHLADSIDSAMSFLTGVNDVERNLNVVKTGKITPAVQSASAALSALLLVKKNVDFIVQHGGSTKHLVSLLSQALAHKEVAITSSVAFGVAMHVIRALSRLNTDPRTAHAVFRDGGVAALAAILLPTSALFKNGAMVAAVLTTLASLADATSRSAEHARYFVELGLVTQCVALMHEHAQNSDVMLAALRFLVALLPHPAAVEAMYMAGAATAIVVTALKLHGTRSAEIASLAIETVASIGGEKDEKRWVQSEDADFFALALLSMTQFRDGASSDMSAAASDDAKADTANAAAVRHLHQFGVAACDMAATISTRLRAVLRKLKIVEFVTEMRSHHERLLLDKSDTSGDVVYVTLAESLLTRLAHEAELAESVARVEKEAQKREQMEQKELSDMDDQLAKNLAFWAKEVAKWEAEAPERAAEYHRMIAEQAKYEHERKSEQEQLQERIKSLSEKVNELQAARLHAAKVHGRGAGAYLRAKEEEMLKDREFHLVRAKAKIAAALEDYSELESVGKKKTKKKQDQPRGSARKRSEPFPPPPPEASDEDVPPPPPPDDEDPPPPPPAH